MTRIDQIIADALAGSPETHVAILAREVVRLREAPAVVVPEMDAPTICGLIETYVDDPREIDGVSTAQAVTRWLREHSRAIPADRVLGEGGAWAPPTPVTDAALVEVRSWIHAVGPVGAMVWVDPQEVLKVAGVRVLGDGMVAVSVEAIRDIEIYIRGKGIVQPTHQEFKDRNFVLDEIRSKLRALRANQGGAEHV